MGVNVKDVLVIGGGNAALCAALTAREAGKTVLLLEGSPFEWRGGNSQHTRNLRCMHNEPQDVLTGAYTEEEYWQDLLKVTGGITNEHLAKLVIRSTANCRDWMRTHGVRFQPSLSGTLHLSRTNAFFMGGGKALINAYYNSAQSLGIELRYNSPVASIERDGDLFRAAILETGERIEAKSCVLAAGGFESNLQWLDEAWGENAWGERPAKEFLIRGTQFNKGVLLRHLIDTGADHLGDPTQAHMVAIDARAPLYDGGICTRVDCVPLGVVVNHEGKRFYDEGEDFWPKRYAIWGRLVAQQRGQIAWSIIDHRSMGRFMPTVFPPTQANSIPELATALGLPADAVKRTIDQYNTACVSGTFDHTIMDDCHTEGLDPPKTHWAMPIVEPPFYGYPLKPGITFTYLSLKTDDTAAVRFNDRPSPNLFVAGEMMAGNILGKGYTGGIGMAIGTIFGQIAGANAANAADAIAYAAIETV